MLHTACFIDWLRHKKVDKRGYADSMEITQACFRKAGSKYIHAYTLSHVSDMVNGLVIRFIACL
jgi:hypothetical protein